MKKSYLLRGQEVKVIKVTQEKLTLLNVKTGHVFHADREWFLDNAKAK